MNVVEPRFLLVHYTQATADMIHQLYTTRVWYGQRPACVAMDTAAAAAAVARDAAVVVWQKISDTPVGKIHRTAAFELRVLAIRHKHISGKSISLHSSPYSNYGEDNSRYLT